MLEKGLPQEYLYVFKYPCELRRRDADDSGIVKEKLIILSKLVDCLEKCLICRHIRRFAD